MSLNLNLSLTLEKTSPALWEQNYKRYDFVASRYRHLMYTVNSLEEILMLGKIEGKRIRGNSPKMAEE